METHTLKNQLPLQKGHKKPPPPPPNPVKGSKKPPPPKPVKILPLTFHVNVDLYKPFMKRLRRALIGNDYCSITKEGDHFIDVSYIVTEVKDKILSVVVRKWDLYVIALGGGIKYTFRDEFSGSKPLRMEEDYQSMEGLKDGEVGYHALKKTVIHLISRIDVEDYNTLTWKSHMVTIIVMTSEAARFNWISNSCSTLMLEKRNTKIEPWMQLINDWQDYSEEARNYNHDGSTKIQWNADEKAIKTKCDCKALFKRPKLCRKWVKVLACPKPPKQ